MSFVEKLLKYGRGITVRSEIDQRNQNEEESKDMQQQYCAFGLREQCGQIGVDEKRERKDSIPDEAPVPSLRRII